MVEGTKALINFGELSKPATVLIEKISEAVGGIFKPYQIKRVARAEAEVSKIKVQADIEISEIQQRAFMRFINEETRKQINMEEITARAINYLPYDAKPEELDEDWLANFFEKSRLISDEEMQNLWARILAGEATKSKSFSKRTVNLVAELEKSDAELFTSLCSFCWLEDKFYIIFFFEEEKFNESKGITFESIAHLDSLGLIKFQSPTGFAFYDIEKITISYYSKPLTIELNKPITKLPIGNIMLTKQGEELVQITNAKKIDEMYDFIKNIYKKKNFVIV